jgi:hypothetical protein
VQALHCVVKLPVQIKHTALQGSQILVDELPKYPFGQIDGQVLSLEI